MFSGRADLVIGAPGDSPPETGAAGQTVRRSRFISPSHPGISLPGPKSGADDRGVAVSRSRSPDTSRSLAPGPQGAVGQDTLTVSTMQAKLEAQLQWLGVGFLPFNICALCARTGQLVPNRSKMTPRR